MRALEEELKQESERQKSKVERMRREGEEEKERLRQEV